MLTSMAFGADEGMTTLLLVLCATVIMVVLLRRRQFRGTTQRDMARDHVARVRDQHRLRQSMDELLVQLEEVSRRVGAQVDTKFAKLEKVIRDADDRIGRLEGALGRAGGEPTDPPVTMPSAPTNPAASPPQADAGVDSDLLAANGAPVKPVDPRLERMYELVDAGASPIKVAEQLDMPLGEVELILNLRKLR